VGSGQRKERMGKRGGNRGRKQDRIKVASTFNTHNLNISWGRSEGGWQMFLLL